jgi:hypothetical protein
VTLLPLTPVINDRKGIALGPVEFASDERVEAPDPEFDPGCVLDGILLESREGGISPFCSRKTRWICVRKGRRTSDLLGL